MTIIIRYVMREYLKLLALCEGGLLLVVVLVDFFEKLGGFIEHNADGLAMAAYAAYKLPELAFHIVTPIAILMATLLTMNQFVRSHEMTAMKASGMNLVRVTAPLWLFSLLVSLVLLLLDQSLIPQAHRQAERVRLVEIEGQRIGSYLRQRHLWFRQGDDMVVNASAVEPQQGTLLGANVYSLGRDFTFPEEIEAHELRHEHGQWVLQTGIKREFLRDGTILLTSFDSLPIAFEGTLAQFQQVRINPDEMTVPELQQYIEQLARFKYPSTVYQVDLQARWALPFVSLIMALFGVALVLREWRVSGVTLAIVTSLAVAVGYFLLYTFMLSIGKGGVVHPFLAAWTANMLFLAVGGYLFTTVHQ